MWNSRINWIRTASAVTFQMLILQSIVSVMGNLNKKSFKWKFATIFLKMINPISGKVWNDVMRQGWVNLSHKCFRLHKYPKQPHSVQNLSLAIYFDIHFAIESKASPKWGIFLMLLALVWQWSKLRLFKPKNIKIWNSELQKSYIPQKKAEKMYNKDSARKKMWISGK